MINKKYIKYLIAFYYINILRHLFISLKRSLQNTLWRHYLYRSLSTPCYDSSKWYDKKKLSQFKRNSFTIRWFFCRCHRSYIVNLKYVERIEGMNCITKNKQVIPISKKYKNDFIEKSWDKCETNLRQKWDKFETNSRRIIL